MNDPMANMFGGNHMNPMLQMFQQFRQNFKGDARQQIQELMNNGKVNQGQYNQAVQMANQFARMFGGMFNGMFGGK